MGFAFYGMREVVARAVASLGSWAQAQPGLLHLIIRADREPRGVGSASADSVASWRPSGGTSGGAETAMPNLAAITAVRQCQRITSAQQSRMSDDVRSRQNKNLSTLHIS